MTSPTSIKGQRAEELAAAHLERAGYRILQRNYRCRLGEIDLIAEEQGVLCFVEVRSLRSLAHGHPLETVDHGKRTRLLRAVLHYLTRSRAASRVMRFDVVSVVYEPALTIELVRDAFQSADPWS